MPASMISLADGSVAFLPHRLNRQLVVVRGLTADELWICAGLVGAAGFLLGLGLAWVAHSIALLRANRWRKLWMRKKRKRCRAD